MIICDWCSMWNYIEDKWMARGTEFNPATICERVTQYNSKHGTTPKMVSVDWKPSPPIY